MFFGYDKGDIIALAKKGLAQNYKDELSAQLGKDTDTLSADTIAAVICSCLDNNPYIQVFRDKDGQPQAVFGISTSGAVTYLESAEVTPHMRVKWARANKDLLANLNTLLGVRPWCYSDSRNHKAARLLDWFKFHYIPERDININNVTFHYYEH